MHLIGYTDSSQLLEYATYFGAAAGYLALIFVFVTQGEVAKLRRRAAALESRLAGPSGQE